MVSGGGGRGGGGVGVEVPRERIFGPMNPKEPRIQINYTSSEASDWSVWAVQ